MPVIKRYPNRKLYDTEAKQYITLDGIAALIRKGEEVHVVDYATGEDLTAVTLAQIIMEQEKKGGGFLPRSVLTGLIQAGGDRFSALQRTLSSSLSLWKQIDEEIQRRIQMLVKQGELTEKEGSGLIEKLLALGNEPKESADTESTEQMLQSFLSQHQIPTRQDYQLLLEQLDSLSNQIDQLNRSSQE